MTEPTIICPNCKTEIKLTESLAAPLVMADKAVLNAFPGWALTMEPFLGT